MVVCMEVNIISTSIHKYASAKYVCFKCRIYHRRNYKDLNEKTWPKCHECKKYMTNVSCQFQPPKKSDKYKWKLLDKNWLHDARTTYEEYCNNIM